MAGRRKQPLLLDVMPVLAEELARLLDDARRPDLASQLPALKVKSRCDCGDDFCSTIYTGPGRPAYSIDLEPAEGMMIVDLDDEERILGIEILDRPEYRKAVDDLFPVAR